MQPVAIIWFPVNLTLKMGKGTSKQAMMTFALNHMTVPSMTVDQACALVQSLQMSGIEIRNDLATSLPNGGEGAATLLPDHSILAVAEVKAFNAYGDHVNEAAMALMDEAVACGAKGIALIPQVGGAPVSKEGLRLAMDELGPALAAREMTGLIEPIGFANSSIRTKAEVVALIDTHPFGAQFGLIHDTFHHHLAAEGTIFPAHTKMVHISGVPRAKVAVGDLVDADRVLVDADDGLGNVTQISQLMHGGYNGPFSFEAFSPGVHALSDPKAALSRSIRFIEDAVMAHAA